MRGVMIRRYRTRSGVGFQYVCEVPRGTKTPDPARISRISSPFLTQRVPSSTYHASSSLRCTCSGAIHRGGPGGAPASCHSAITKLLSVDPRTWPASEFAIVAAVIADYFISNDVLLEAHAVSSSS